MTTLQFAEKKLRQFLKEEVTDHLLINDTKLWKWFKSYYDLNNDEILYLVKVKESILGYTAIGKQ